METRCRLKESKCEIPIYKFENFFMISFHILVTSYLRDISINLHLHS